LDCEGVVGDYPFAVLSIVVVDAAVVAAVGNEKWFLSIAQQFFNIINPTTNRITHQHLTVILVQNCLKVGK
jgi:hypothetical protein